MRYPCDLKDYLATLLGGLGGQRRARPCLCTHRNSVCTSSTSPRETCSRPLVRDSTAAGVMSCRGDAGQGGRRAGAPGTVRHGQLGRAVALTWCSPQQAGLSCPTRSGRICAAALCQRSPSRWVHGKASDGCMARPAVRFPRKASQSTACTHTPAACQSAAARAARRGDLACTACRSEVSSPISPRYVRLSSSSAMPSTCRRMAKRSEEGRRVTREQRLRWVLAPQCPLLAAEREGGQPLGSRAASRQRRPACCAACREAGHARRACQAAAAAPLRAEAAVVPAWSAAPGAAAEPGHAPEAAAACTTQRSMPHLRSDGQDLHHLLQRVWLQGKGECVGGVVGLGE